MGKQKKQKQRRRPGTGGGGGGKSNGNTARKSPKELGVSWKPRVDLSKASTYDRAVILKIRHGDARIRDGALSALSVTLFSGASENKKISNELLQAISERIVVDTDIPSTCAAAGCLLNYVQSCDEHCERLLMRVPHLDIWSVLVSRISKASTVLHAEWRVTSLCLQILVTLVESGYCANNQSLTESLSSSHKSLVQTVFEALVTATTSLEQQQQTSYATPLGKPAAAALDEIRQAVISSVEFGARFLHSLLDGNEETNGDTNGDNNANEFARTVATVHINSISCVNVLHRMITKTDQSWISLKTKLHASGALVSLRQSLEQDDELKHQVDTLVMDNVVSLISGTISGVQCDKLKELSQQVADSHSNLLQEHEDLAMENKAEENVKARNEPARLIARRQKLQKEHKKENPQAVDMTVDDTEASAKGAAEDAIDNSISDPLAVYDKAVEAWNSSVLPLLLALEVLASLTSCGYNDPNSEDDDDDMAWASDDEDRMDLMAQQGQIGSAAAVPVLLTSQDEALFEKCNSLGLPDQVLALLQLISSSMHVNTSLVVSSGIHELVDKCAACLGNLITNMPPQNWRSTQEQTLALWKSLLQVVQSQLDRNDNSASHLTSLSSTLLALLRTRSHLIVRSIDEAQLTLLLSLLNPSLEVECRQHAVGMLGLLTSEPHSDAVNTLVCRALLTALKDDQVLLVAQVLNVFMDMYSHDVEYQSVFKQEQVLQAFQQYVPLFRINIGKAKRILEDDQVHHLRETVLNASRFIKYKQGR